MTHEVIGHVERVMRGIAFENEEALGVEVVEKVGPGGTLVDREHTAAHLRQELWFPAPLDRGYYGEWAQRGKPALSDRCRERKEQLLRDHRPPLLPEDVDREIQRVPGSAPL